jgi:hypothetical protein
MNGRLVYPVQLQAAIPVKLRSVFVTEFRHYGLQAPFPPQLVLPTPSAWATVGTTKVFRKSTAAATAKSTRFIGESPCYSELSRDIFTTIEQLKKSR